MAAKARRGTDRWLLVLLAIAVVATAVEVVRLWPSGESKVDSEAVFGRPTLYNADVEGIRRGACIGSVPEEGLLCNVADIKLTEGPDKDRTRTIDAEAFAPGAELREGDRIVVSYAKSGDVEIYAFAEFQRRSPLVGLVVMFGLAVVVLGRWRGLRALVGLAFSLAVIVAFVVPSILRDNSPVEVAIAGSAVLLLVSLYLTHGLKRSTTVALLGTFASLVLTGVLAYVFVEVSRITGLATEEAFNLTAISVGFDVSGLVLGGIVIGALGVLDDVTVTQASAVAELRRANPGYSKRELYGSALRIGRDHIASTVNTLVLAYAGASLPVLLLLVESEQPLNRLLTSELVATEIIRTLVGSIGLVASVPITTVLAAAASDEEDTLATLVARVRERIRARFAKLTRARPKREYRLPAAEREWRQNG